MEYCCVFSTMRISALCMYCLESAKVLKGVLRSSEPTSTFSSFLYTLPKCASGCSEPLRRIRTHRRSIKSSKVYSWSTCAPRPMFTICRFQVSMPSPPRSRLKESLTRGMGSFRSISSTMVSPSADERYQLFRSSSSCSCPGAQPAYPTNMQKSSRAATPDSTSSVAVAMSQ